MEEDALTYLRNSLENMRKLLKDLHSKIDKDLKNKSINIGNTPEMKKKKDFRPNTMKDLEEIYYGKNGNRKDTNFERLQQYEDDIRSRIESKNQEQEVKVLFSPVSELEKIKEKKGEKTFDFKDESEKLLIEVTSLNTPAYPNPNFEINLIDRINNAISHIEEKDASEFQDYLKGGVVFWSILFDFFSEIGKIILSRNILDKTIFPKSKLDFLVLLPESASINGRSSRELYPPIIYVKEKRVQTFFENKLPQIRVILLGSRR